MRQEMRALFRRYGERLTLEQPTEPLTIYGFIQCPLSHNKDLPLKPTPLGMADQRQWYYWGDTAVAADHRLSTKDSVFRVKESGVVRMGSQPIFFRAVLTPEREVGE